MSASKIYLDAIYNRFSFLGSWLPNSAIALGDIGVLEGGLFKRLTSLRSLGILFETSLGNNSVDFAFTSAMGVEIQAEIGARVSAPAASLAANAGLTIRFSREGGFVFHAADCFVDEIKDKVRIGRSIIGLYRLGQWEKQWGVVDTLVRTGAATIVVCNSSKAVLELTADAPIDASSLARANSGLKVKSQAGDVVRFIAQQGLTPLFKLSRIKLSILGDAGRLKFGSSHTDSAFSAYEKVFEQVLPN